MTLELDMLILSQLQAESMPSSWNKIRFARVCWEHFHIYPSGRDAIWLELKYWSSRESAKPMMPISMETQCESWTLETLRVCCSMARSFQITSHPHMSLQWLVCEEDTFSNINSYLTKKLSSQTRKLLPMLCHFANCILFKACTLIVSQVLFSGFQLHSCLLFPSDCSKKSVEGR